MNKALFLYYYFRQRYFRNFKNRTQLERWQDKKVQYFLNRVKKKSLFYRNYFLKKNIEPINKIIMMENFDSLNTVNIKKEEAFNIALKSEKTRDFSPTLNKITIGLSSGTSGNRGLFIASKREQTLWAATILAKVLPTSILCREKYRIAFFLRANSNLYKTLGTNKIQFVFFDLLNDLDSHINRLNEYQPNIIVGPASLLRMLSKEKTLNKLNINPIKIISVAEVLEEIDEKFISKAFNQRVHQIYQCTEGFLGYTCNYGTIHLNEDIVKIDKEYIDDKRFYPIITDFHRISQPIINYKLNDILIEKENICPCGSPLISIEKIEGRSDDLFIFENDKGDNQIVFPDFIRRIIISSSDDVLEYQVIQLTDDSIQIYILISEEKNRIAIENLIRNNFIIFCNENNLKVPTNITFNKNIIHENGSKLRRIFKK